MAETKQLTVIDSIRKMEPEFKAALPSHITPERFTRNAMTAINGNPDLLSPEIDKRSLFASVMKAAQDGLVLDNKEAALVTFDTKDGKKVQYMPMVSGLLKKMRNSGEVSNIGYGLVYMNEYKQGRFKYTKGDNESLTHDPILFEEKGDLIGVYAVVTLKDGSRVREFMDMEQVKKIRSNSKAGNSQYGPWTKWFEEMCVKSVLRKVYKLCPSSSDIDQLFSADDRDDDFVSVSLEQPLQDVPEPKKETRTARAVKSAMEDIDGEVLTVVSGESTDKPSIGDGTDKPPL